MAAPPDLINDPPSLICRYKDRSLKTRSLFPFPPPPRSSPSPRRGHQGERDREQTFISVLERANARKGGLRPPLPSLSLSPSFFLSVVVRQSATTCALSSVVVVPPLFLDPFRRFITPAWRTAIRQIVRQNSCETRSLQPFTIHPSSHNVFKYARVRAFRFIENF